jgi:hypothetical protein
MFEDLVFELSKTIEVSLDDSTLKFHFVLLNGSRGIT